MERLTKGEARLVAEVGRPASAPARPADCVLTLKKRRFDRERAELQREIDRLQEQGGASDHREMDVLLTRKRDLARRIEEMGAGKIA
jgi:hypothetical protein